MTGWPTDYLMAPEVEPPAPTPARGPGLRIAGLVAAGALVGGGAGVGVGAAIAGGGNTVVLGASGNHVVTSPASASSTSYASVAAAVLPSVVSIDVTGDNSEDTGSGVVLRSDGYILTNNHVIANDEDNSGSIRVTFNNGSTASASIVGYDASYDLAVIKVSRSGLTAATLGDSSTLRVGDPVLAVGSPLGLQGTVTNGIVSALNRAVQTSDQTSPLGGGTTAVINAIQTDAPINPGNSGGPLVDMAGQVIGINSAIASLGSGFGSQSGSIGVGFAIPIDVAKTIAGELIATGHATHPVLGVSVADVTANNGATQVLVQQVASGGPAASAGIRAGDIIVALNGHPISDADSLIALIRSYQPGQNVTVTLERGGSQRTVTVQLGNSTASQG